MRAINKAALERPLAELARVRRRRCRRRRQRWLTRNIPRTRPTYTCTRMGTYRATRHGDRARSLTRGARSAPGVRAGALSASLRHGFAGGIDVGRVEPATTEDDERGTVITRVSYVRDDCKPVMSVITDRYTDRWSLLRNTY